jgi:hypothetical protein
MSRPRIGDPGEEGVLTPKERQARYRQRLKQAGGRELTIKLTDAAAIKALGELTAQRGLGSDTETATWLLEEALKRRR